MKPRYKVKNWSKYLHAFRARYNLTQQQLADLLDVSVHTVRKWEITTHNAGNPPTFLKLALERAEGELNAKPPSIQQIVSKV